MKSILKTILRNQLDNAFGDRLRAVIQTNPPWYVRPWTDNTSISDLFPWRCDEEWQTRFDIMNLPSLVFPEQNPIDNILFVIFDKNGEEITRLEESLEPFQMNKIIINEILINQKGYGTFACFHHSPKIDGSSLNGSYFIDRQYVAFKRFNEPLWNFTHGNVAALTHRPNAKGFGCLTTKPKKNAVYRPQMHFNDCDNFELAYANPTLRNINLKVTYLDRDRNVINHIRTSIAPAGIEVLSYENIDRNCISIEHEGPIELWRPIVFKYYNTHFDVLHS